MAHPPWQYSGADNDEPPITTPKTRTHQSLPTTYFRHSITHHPQSVTRNAQRVTRNPSLPSQHNLTEVTILFHVLVGILDRLHGEDAVKDRSNLS